jgi:hypothetical protein
MGNCANAASGAASAPCASSPLSTAQLRQDSAVLAAPPATCPERWRAEVLPVQQAPDADRAALRQITARCEELKAISGWVFEFADMLCHRHGERLEAWAAQAETSPVSELRGFAKGVRKTGPRSPPGSPCPTAATPSKATSTRIKMIKRQIYGGANPTCSANAACSPTYPITTIGPRATAT